MGAVAIRPPWQRRLFHAVAGSILPILALFVSEPLPAILAGALALVGLSLDLLRFRVTGINRLFLRYLRILLKSNEGSRITGATYLLIGSCLSFVLFDPNGGNCGSAFPLPGRPGGGHSRSVSGRPEVFRKVPAGHFGVHFCGFPGGCRTGICWGYPSQNPLFSWAPWWPPSWKSCPCPLTTI